MKTKPKIFLIFLLVLTFPSCEVKLEDNMRILVKGVVQDQDNLPIPDTKIYVTTKNGSGYYVGSGGQREYVLGEGYCETDGNFSVISFFDKDEDFAVEVDAGDDYSKYIYKANTEDYTPLDLTFDLGLVRLNKMANFNYNINRANDENNTIAFSIKYIDGFCLESYEGDELNEYQTYCFEEVIISRSLDGDNPNFDSTLRVPLNEIIEFTYSINQQSEFTETITINQENYDFTFNY